ncbi:MAG: nucleotidyltransferase [Lachnospiraceae bacterium]|nr:nucleotidyltransferase [Lachnospiraceae bacterium]
MKEKQPILVILAAGMGSRYGGLKQIDPVDDKGHKIIDFSVYDAVKAGFRKVVFIIKRENLQDFKEAVGDAVERFIEVAYVFQDTAMLPEGYTVPAGREKPWGTAHAVLCAQEEIDAPFAVINADDFYGRDAFEKIHAFLMRPEVGKDSGKYLFAMVGYALKNTLTENGYVSRGICEVSPDGELSDIVERTKIERVKGEPAYTEDGSHYIPVSEDAVVSMNIWGFTEDYFPEAKRFFRDFLENEAKANPLKAEFFLPTVVDRLIRENKASVTVLKTDARWFGVTYKEDKPFVTDSVRKLKEAGVYPEILWE